MRVLILRTLPASVVLIAGIASVVYGVAFHSSPVTSEQEIEIPPPPPPFIESPDQFPLDGPPGEFPEMGPPPMPPPFLGPVKETVIVTDDESELDLIREITIGGVTLLASGLLRRTYSGDPPTLCPT